MQQKQTLEQLLSNDSFVRFISSKASAREKQFWAEWFREYPDEVYLLEQARELMTATQPHIRNVPDPAVELKKFETALGKYQLEERVKRRNNIRVRPAQKRPSQLLRWTAVAAVGLAVVFTGFFLSTLDGTGQAADHQVSNTVTSHYQTGYGEKANLSLSDGSKIILNANSELSYTYTGRPGSGQNMEVWLQGEAWFDIEGNTGQPRIFQVHTPEGTVEVLGTTFVVSSSGNGTQTILETGEVKIKTQNSENVRDITMKPGELAMIPADGSMIELREVNTELYTSWTKDVWTFDRTPLTEVALRIETLFGVEVDIACGELEEKTLSGAISSTNLTLIKEGLSQALQDEIRQEENRIRIGSASGPCTEET